MSSPEFLKSVELRLLRCTYSSPSAHCQPPLSPSSGSFRSMAESLLVSIERGCYAEALSSTAVNHLLFVSLESLDLEDSVDSATGFYDEVERCVESFLREDYEVDDHEGRIAVVLCLGVASLLAFMQQNVTGPVVEFSQFPVEIPVLKMRGQCSGWDKWEVWARDNLTSLGADLDGKILFLQYIVYAQTLLRKIKGHTRDGCDSYLSARSISWWLSRHTLLHQWILDEPSSYLYDLLKVYKDEMLLHFDVLEKITSYWGSSMEKQEAITIASLSQLEAAVIEYTYGRIDSLRFHLNCAEVACGLNLSLTGALGVRTIHQVEPKAQMVLVAKPVLEKNNDTNQSLETQSDETRSKSHICGHYDDCDILMKPRLIENITIDSGRGYNFTSIQAAVVLVQCLYFKRSSRNDELTSWKMAPYIEAIDTREQSCYIIRYFCDIMRVWWESTRNRTKERALLMMAELVESTLHGGSSPSQRIQFAFGVYVPTIPALRKEYGELLVSLGLPGEATKTFQDLELWDNLILCYRLLGKNAAAVDLIKKQLSNTPADHRLWCSLGDVTNNDIHYEKALEVSNNKSARAKRTLARNAYNRGEYKKSKELWESAMSQNSLYPNGWFALGASALKDRDIEKAIDGFTRAVQLDPENGEAWNNIAMIHFIKKKNKESFVAFKEALKFRRSSWQLWDNYSQVAFDVGNLGQALEAVKMVLDLSENKRVNLELLDQIMRKVEDKSSTLALSVKSLKSNPDTTNCGCPLVESSDMSECSKTVFEMPQKAEILVDMIGNIFQQIIKSGGNEDVWGIYARWHKIKGNLSMCSEALLKQVRSYQGSDLWHDRNRFKKFTSASLELCKVYMEIATATGSIRELNMAEMHLKNSVKQAVNFVDTEDFKGLQDCLQEVRQRIYFESNGVS